MMKIIENIDYDKAGFPIIKVRGVNFWMHALPITKLQFEYFICEKPIPIFDEAFYKAITGNDMNPRITPRKADINNYWQLFLTGIKPSEAKLYADWCGEGYDFPTLEEWEQVFNVLKIAPLEDLFSEFKLDPPGKYIFENLDGIVPMLFDQDNKKMTCADQFLMRYGVIEWVYEQQRGSRHWRGMGFPNPNFIKTGKVFSSLSPHDPNDPEFRMRAYGFRLIKREKK